MFKKYAQRVEMNRRRREEMTRLYAMQADLNYLESREGRQLLEKRAEIEAERRRIESEYGQE